MTVFVYDIRMVPFLWAGLRPVKPEHLTYDRACLITLTTGRVPLYPFHVEKATFLMPFSTSTTIINLTTREQVIDHVTSRFLVKTNKDTRKRLLLLKDEEFFNTLRFTIALKKWYLQEEESAPTYKLFSDLMDSHTKALGTLFGLLREKPMGQVWAAVLTFLNRSERLDDVPEDTSEFYRTLLSRANKAFVGWRPRAMSLLSHPRPSDLPLAATILGLRG